MDIHTWSVVWIALALGILSVHLVLSYRAWRHIDWVVSLLASAIVALVTTLLWFGLAFVIALRIGFSSHPYTWPEEQALMDVMGLFGLLRLPYDLGNVWAHSSVWWQVVSLFIGLFLLGLLPISLRNAIRGIRRHIR